MDSLVGRVLYALACIAVPVVWGFVIVWVSSAVERRVRDKHNRQIPPIEYHI